MTSVRNLIIPFAGSLGEVWGWLGEASTKAPFPYDGGKSRAAQLIMERLGLSPGELPPIVTVNDVNCYLANFWRAVHADPEGVAEHASWPVSEADMHARHRWLLGIEGSWPPPVGPCIVPREHAGTAGLAAAWRAGWLAGHRSMQPSDYDAFQHAMRTDPHFFDVRIAGWWVWGQCMWIGSGWCNDTLYERNKGQRPNLGDSVGGNGVHSKRPQLCNGTSTAGPGVLRHPDPPGRRVDGGVREQVPDLSGSRGAAGRGIAAAGGPKKSAPRKDGTQFGSGVHSVGPNANNRPRLAEEFGRGVGVHGGWNEASCEQRLEWLKEWFQRLSDIMRTWRICCGDWNNPEVWRRVCSSRSVTTRCGLTAVFLDPPYLDEIEDADGNTVKNRQSGLYAADCGVIAHAVRKWCLKDVQLSTGEIGPRYTDPMLRIALCGLEGEHNELEALGWTKVAWKSPGGYGNRSGGKNANRDRERVWFSPHCESLTHEERAGLFAGVEEVTNG